MQFDDRLATVLRFRADGEVTSRIQFRQLLDLLGNRTGHGDGTQYEAALARIGELGHRIPAGERAGIIRDGGLRLRSPQLVALLAGSEPEVAAAAVAKANLSAEQWQDLLPALSPAARAELRQRNDLDPALDRRLTDIGIYDRGLPPGPQPEAFELDPVTILPPEADQPNREGIGAIVERIEAYRRSRQVIDAPASGEAPRLPLGEDHVLGTPRQARAFDFATDPEGRIVWSDPGVSAMVSWLALPALSTAVGSAIRQHQPLRALQVELNGSPTVAGAWQIDASPHFDRLSGSFAGYQGRMRRRSAISASPAPDSEADRIRQLLHELRTPVNAIQGFAEVIQQQLFGPTPHDYRALAAAIAGDAARMLAAFEELERLARLQSGAMELDPGETDFAALLTATAHQLEPHTRQRSVSFEFSGDTRHSPVAMAEGDAERLVWRLLATLGGAAAPGETLGIVIAIAPDASTYVFDLPQALRSKAPDEVFTAAVGSVPQAITAGVFGVGFALRLARAEAKAVGGSLEVVGEALRLRLPGLTAAAAGHSHGSATTEA
jgi:signal transduction histidine kinase